MTTTSFGLITDTAGAATPVTTDRTIRCRRIRFRARNANTGLVSIGLVGFTAGGAGMIGEVLKPSSGYSDEVLIESEVDDIYPANYSIKPATNGDGVYVSAETR
jgi:hypothetical protein